MFCYAKRDMSLTRRYMRLLRKNFIRQRVLGGGTKTHAGANVWVTRTEVKNIAPK